MQPEHQDVGRDQAAADIHGNQHEDGQPPAARQAALGNGIGRKACDDDRIRRTQDRTRDGDKERIEDIPLVQHFNIVFEGGLHREDRDLRRHDRHAVAERIGHAV